MKRLCFITQCALPIPTVKGGAVETLVEYIINENEKVGKYQITVFSVYDEAAEAQSKKYKYTKLVYISNTNHKADKVLLQIYRVLKHANIFIPFSCTFIKVLKELKTLPDHDFYIYEAGPTTQIPIISKIVPKDKILVHLHWDGMGTPKKDAGCKYLISISDYIGMCWKKATGAAEEKIKVVKNCVNLELFDRTLPYDEKQKLREKLGVEDDDKVVMFVGRIVQDKGVRELIHAFDNISRENLVLMIIGSANFGNKTKTPYEKEIQTMINKSKKKIVFTGYIHQQDLYKYYSISTCAVMPSQFQEPAGLVALEAQATGTPLIATRVGGLPEFVDRESTILIEKDEYQIINMQKAILSLIDNPEKCKSMGAAGKKFVCGLDEHSYFKNFCSIIDKEM